MNIRKNILLACLVIVPLSVEAIPHKNINKTFADWNAFCKKYIPPMLISGVIGAGTGSFVRHLEKEFKVDQSPEYMVWLAISWYAEYTVRNSIISSIQKDFDDCQIVYQRNAMYLSAWISSWMAYLRMNVV